MMSILEQRRLNDLEKRVVELESFLGERAQRYIETHFDRVFAIAIEKYEAKRNEVPQRPTLSLKASEPRV